MFKIYKKGNKKYFEHWGNIYNFKTKLKENIKKEELEEMNANSYENKIIDDFYEMKAIEWEMEYEFHNGRIKCHNCGNRHNSVYCPKCGHC